MTFSFNKPEMFARRTPNAFRASVTLKSGSSFIFVLISAPG